MTIANIAVNIFLQFFCEFQKKNAINYDIIKPNWIQLIFIPHLSIKLYGSEKICLKILKLFYYFLHSYLLVPRNLCVWSL